MMWQHAMDSRRRRLLAGGSALLLLSGTSAAALAHHGWSGYLDEDFALSGTVESARLGNPHGLIKVRAAEGVWDVVLGPARNQQRAGLTEAEVPPGAEITAYGHRHQNPKRLEMKTERLRVGDRDFAIYPNRL
jgi:hypothetical protein